MIAGNAAHGPVGFARNHGQTRRVGNDEPERVAEAVSRLKLKHVVITAVARDDVADGGAEHFRQTIEAIRARDPKIVIEVLTPDFNAADFALQKVPDARPHIFNHNLETVERPTPLVRSRAKYDLSLAFLKRAKELLPSTVTKSGLMLGLGRRRTKFSRRWTICVRRACRC